MKFLILETIIQTTRARTTMAASHGNRKMTTNHGRTGTTNNGKTEIINHGKQRQEAMAEQQKQR